MWPEATTSRTGERRAPTPPTKSDPPQLAADISPKPAAAVGEFTDS